MLLLTLFAITVTFGLSTLLFAKRTVAKENTGTIEPENMIVKATIDGRRVNSYIVNR